MYAAEMVEPMIREVTEAGFEEMKTPEQVDEMLGRAQGVTLLLVNSVCGCAAGSARPAVKMALRHHKKPDKLLTVFAGVDKEATERARTYLLPFPPSSPSIGIFKGNKLVHFLERRDIEGRSAEMIAENIKSAVEDLC